MLQISSFTSLCPILTEVLYGPNTGNAHQPAELALRRCHAACLAYAIDSTMQDSGMSRWLQIQVSLRSSRHPLDLFRPAGRWP